MPRERYIGHKHERGYRYVRLLIGRKDAKLQVSNIVWLLCRSLISEGWKVS